MLLHFLRGAASSVLTELRLHPSTLNTFLNGPFGPRDISKVGLAREAGGLAVSEQRPMIRQVHHRYGGSHANRLGFAQVDRFGEKGLVDLRK